MKCKICKKVIRGEGQVLISGSVVGKRIVSHVCMQCYRDPVKMDRLVKHHDELLTMQDRLFEKDKL